MIENRKIVIERIGERFGDCTAIVSEPLREPAPGELLIRDRFAGVNGVYDQMMCLDRVERTRVVPPADTGVEAVGTVEAVGEGVRGFTAGDPVAVVGAGRGYRLFQFCPAEKAIRVPEASPRVLALIPSGYTSDRLPPERVTDERIYTRLYWKAASVRGFMNYRFAEHFPRARERLFSRVSRGDLNPLIDRRAFRGLEAVPEAVEFLLAGRNLGKVFVDLQAGAGP